MTLQELSSSELHRYMIYYAIKSVFIIIVLWGGLVAAVWVIKGRELEEDSTTDPDFVKATWVIKAVAWCWLIFVVIVTIGLVLSNLQMLLSPETWV